MRNYAVQRAEKNISKPKERCGSCDLVPCGAVTFRAHTQRLVVLVTGLICVMWVGCGLETGGVADSPQPDAMTPMDGGPDTSSGDVNMPDMVVLDVIQEDAPTITFTPPDLAGLQAWYRSDMGVTPGTGNGVAAWADQSGSGDANRDLKQATAGLQPQLTMTDPAFNNRPSLRTTVGTVAYLTTGTWNMPIAQAFTVFAVARPTGSAGWLFDSPTVNKEVGIHAHGLTALRIFAGSYGADVTAPINTTYALVAIFDSAGVNSRLYVSQNTPQAGATVGVNAPSPLMVGDAQGDTTGVWTGWTFAELAFYQGPLLPSDVAKLNAYAAARYGLTIGP